MQIHMKSDRGEIEVFLCPEEDVLNSNLEDLSEDNLSPIKIKREDFNDLLSPHASTTSHVVRSPCTTTSTTIHQLGGSPCTTNSTWEALSRNGGTENDDNQTIRNVLIWESEDLGPIGNRFQQQTVDQEHNNGKILH